MTTVSQWETYLETALAPEDKGNGSYLVHHDARQGSSNMALILISFQPISGESRVVMLVGLRQKTGISVEGAATVTAQGIENHRPNVFYGDGVYYAVIEPFDQYMYFYQLNGDDEETKGGALKFGQERNHLVKCLLYNKTMYRV